MLNICRFLSGVAKRCSRNVLRMFLNISDK